MKQDSPCAVELEVTEGLERLARAEVTGRLGVRSAAINEGRGWLRFPLSQADRISQLRLAESAFQVETFAVPRPKALLGDQHFRRLADAVSNVTAAYHQPARTFTVAAAGSDSSVMLRLREAISRATGLTDAGGEGDLLIRLMRARETNGWDVLLRLTPRPISARNWRVCSFPGALNATVASAMAQLTLPRPNDTFVNLMSGSGSILLERRLLMSYVVGIGIDHDPERISCAAENAVAARLTGQVRWMLADARSIPLPSASAHAITADLPFGQRVGRHEENVELYPPILAEAARIAVPGARFAALTHEVQLMERRLRSQHDWRTIQVLPINLRGLHPRIYLLERV
ncbi:MAG: RNA methyltransferase [Anaerolineae bacterium]|nr:RNA methyltransferase [Anaerolineae bacterium]